MDTTTIYESSKMGIINLDDYRVDGSRSTLRGISFSFGSLQATDEGVDVRLDKGPVQLRNLSRSYPWPMVPLGFVMLRLLVYGGGADALYDSHRLFSILLAGGGQDPVFARTAMSHANWAMDMIASGAMSTRLTRDILDWGIQVAEVCPVKGIAEQLRNLPSMTDVELARYMKGQFSWSSE